MATLFRVSLNSKHNFASAYLDEDLYLVTKVVDNEGRARIIRECDPEIFFRDLKEAIPAETAELLAKKMVRELGIARKEITLYRVGLIAQYKKKEPKVIKSAKKVAHKK